MISHSFSVGARGGWEVLVCIRRGCNEVMRAQFGSETRSCLDDPTVSPLSAALLPGRQRDYIDRGEKCKLMMWIPAVELLSWQLNIQLHYTHTIMSKLQENLSIDLLT